MDTHPIILFDGICNLCNNAVQYVIRHDPNAVFKFTSLQSDKGKQLTGQFGLSGTAGKSFILVEENKAYTKSTAALKVARKLNGVSRLLYVFIIIPPFIRNAIYDLVARNRYKWFGKRESCMVPTASLQTRFLNN